MMSERIMQLKKLKQIYIKGKKYYKIIFIAECVLIICLFIFLILEAEYYNPVKIKKIHDLESLVEIEKIFGQVLEIQNYQKEGSADDYYYMAFSKYLMNYDLHLLLMNLESIDLSKYSMNEDDCLNRNLLASSLISKIDSKRQNNLICDLNCIVQGTKKKKFDSLNLFMEEIKKHNDLFMVSRLFMVAMMNNAGKELNNINNNSLEIVKAAYCYLNHFQYNYPESLFVTILEAKIKILKMLMEHYRLKNDNERYSLSKNIFNEYVKFNDSFNKISFSNYGTPYDKIRFSDNKILLNRPFICALIVMLLYDIDDIDNAIKVAKYRDFRYFQYNSIVSLGIMKNCFWRPLKSYKAHRILKVLKRSDDPMTAYLSEIADKITLYDFFMNSYTDFKYSKYSKIGESCNIYPLIRDKQ